MKNITQSAIKVFAVLDEFSGGNSDILSSLLPFFEPILYEQRGEIFDPSSFSGEVRERYRWNFTSDIAEELIPRFVEKGWLAKARTLSNQGPYEVSIDKQSTDISNAEVEKQISDLVESFVNFIESINDLVAKSYTVDECRDMLIEWLVYVDAYSEDILNYNLRSFEGDDGKLGMYVEFPRDSSLSDDQEYLCARFVQKTLKSNPEAAETLSKIAAVGLLAEVVQDFIRPTSQVLRSDLTVYLDAPIALDLLNVSGKDSYENIKPLIDQLVSMGALVRVYSSTLAEITRVLKAVLEETNRTGPTARAMARGEVLEAYVSAVATNPQNALEKIGIGTTERTIDQFPNQEKYFTKDMHTEMYGGLSFQTNPPAREADATAATFIMRQRQGKRTNDLFDSKYILVTRNPAFSEASKRVCRFLNVIGPNQLGPVIHRRQFATALWLRTGLNTGALEVPKRLVLASCEHVLALRPGVVKAVKKFASEISEDNAVQLELLLQDDRSTQMLMDKTLGVSRVVTRENIGELMGEMLAPHLEAERERARDSEKSIKERNRAKLKAKEQEMIAIQSQLAASTSTSDSVISEDRVALLSAALRAEKIVDKRKMAMRTGSILISVLIGISALMIGSEFGLLNFLGLGIAILMAYLSVTGSRLFSLGKDSGDYIAEFNKVCHRRGIDGKAANYEVRYENENWKISRIP